MSLHLPPAFLPCAMMLSAIFLAVWLASKKSIVIDAIVGLVVVFVIAWIVVSAHIF
jgi:hypothetical protein